MAQKHFTETNTYYESRLNFFQVGKSLFVAKLETFSKVLQIAVLEV